MNGVLSIDRFVVPVAVGVVTAISCAPLSNSMTVPFVAPVTALLNSSTLVDIVAPTHLLALSAAEFIDHQAAA